MRILKLGIKSQSPLPWAAKNGHEGTVKLLVQKNADIQSLDNGGWTPLVLAAKNGNEGAVELLFKENIDL
jgi:ankyrin repeat protein